MEEDILQVQQWPVPPPSCPFHVVIAPGQAREEWPIPPPSRPFHVVIAPGQAREGPKCTKQGPHPPELVYPLKPHQRWDAELRHCDEACKAQITECMQGPATHQAYVRELIVGRWNAEKKKCEEARKVQLLEILLASHGITALV
ncbi:uncharacterized protein BJ212DRAFT_1487053 [Suillus subaureus]|uniref:Uncharacterized protein n=1 Tax=Suillus subaureus TaxID=48587 RepID=A0A9P7DUJ7_9AGAM|nr:uncharacterized protein BJ212DRAFT_1487053 [Suillus subaureus]KAG1803342.1 hypothetical protein BJ212DRAFT_1487053 [Suillus subaureus]